MRVFSMLAYSYCRFSSSEQGHGDSIRRQVALRDAYLKRKELTLDTSFMLPPDKGRSAFHGFHRYHGNLKLFLDAVSHGRVKKGSILLIENLDRLSREESGEALTLFQSLLNAGITVVTLSPEVEFVQGQMDLGRWVVAMAELCRGHGESLIKSSRSKANWEQLRGKIADGPITSRCPSWMKLVDGKWKIDQAKKKTVQNIFSLSGKGWGIGSIAKKLNREGVPPISKATQWYDSYVYKILVNRAVIGEYQPHKRDENHKLVPVGSPVKNYFPPIIEDKVFSASQIAIRNRRKSGGRVSSDVGNLFTGLVSTSTGVKYSLRERGIKYDYLVPNSVAAGFAKNVPCIPYLIFEKFILDWLSELKLDFGSEDTTSGLEAQKQELEENIKDIEAGIRKGGKGVARLVALISEKENELATVTEALELAMIPKANQFGHTQDLIQIMAECPAEERESIRRQIKQQIRFLVKGITVHTTGLPRNPNKSHDVQVVFNDGHVKNIWFKTNKWGLSGHGVYIDWDCRTQSSTTHKKEI